MNKHNTLQSSKTKLLAFMKNWTLPLAMAMGTFVYLLFARVPCLDGVGNVMGPVIDEIFPFFMFLILFVTFCKIDFRKLRPGRWHLWLSVIQVTMVLLCVLFILTRQLKLTELILSEALLACIISPCAAAAPVVTAKLGGNLEQMTTYTFLSNFITATLVPLFFPMIDDSAGMDFLSAFFLILHKVCVILVLPMLLAWFVKHYVCRIHARIIAVNDLSFYVWACSLTIVTGTTVKNIVHAETKVSFLLLIALLSLLLCLLQFFVGRKVGRMFGYINEGGQALGQKNTAFAVWMTYTYLHPVSTVGPGCYILWQNMVNSMELWMVRRKGKECHS